MFKNPFSFEGRIRRMEYGLSFIILVVVLSVIRLAVASGELPIALGYFFQIPIYWFKIAQGAKRCHDLGNNGWWQLIPFYGFWLLFAEGKKEENDYGVNPKNN
jgi:uncharacterized membrane protein YhaH (DUF805 family)